MAYITGLMLIDAPAAALNNGEADQNVGQVKKISSGGLDYPYASSQAYRFWLRTTLERLYPEEWQASPVYSAGAGKRQQAYTQGEPIQYPDDDLLGYMRAEKNDTVTRVSPLRIGTLVSVAPARIVEDFGVMARLHKKEGDKEGVVLHQHQFYRAVLQGLFSLDLWAAGTFTNQKRSGYQNLSKDTPVDNLEAITFKQFGYETTAYRLDMAERIRRVQLLLRGMGRIEGGAKQALHYTDVTPAFIIAAVTRGGNHIFGHLIKTDDRGQPQINPASLRQIGNTLHDELLSGIYVGRVEGFMDESQATLDEFGLTTLHPREALDALANDLDDNSAWMQ